MTHAPFDASDPALFPVDFDVQRGEVGLLPLSSEVVAKASFLDQRGIGDCSHALRKPWQALRTDDERPRLAWLFHTAFCGSTLLSRALQAPPEAVSLREPQALLRFAHAAASVGADAIEPPLHVVVQLLARPWTAGGRVLAKPTNQVNNLLPSLLRLTRGTSILLHSSLPEFITSCCKKLPEAEQFVLWSARHLLRGSRLRQALGVPWDHPFHFVEACVLAWQAQMELYADALANDRDDRLRSLDFAALLAEPPTTVAAAARWLTLGKDDAFWQARAGVEFHRNAKHVERAYDPARRAEERAGLAARYGPLIEAALAWNAEVVAPIASVPSNWKALC